MLTRTYTSQRCKLLFQRQILPLWRATQYTSLNARQPSPAIPASYLGASQRPTVLARARLDAASRKGKRANRPSPSDTKPAFMDDDVEVGEDEVSDDDDDEDASLAPFMSAVVKVFCVHTEPNYSLPWQRKRQYTSTSSGFIVEAQGERYLLTNAHSVDYHTQVKVKKRGDDRKYLARVLSIGVDCDIAMLAVEDPSFWDDTTPLSLGPLPKLQDSVAVVGYPVGGDTISVTVGVVSRIEVTNYTHGSTELLGVQIDAAINGGNSGGPVFDSEGRCVGIAFQSLSGSDVENVGYVIPTPVVHHFVADWQRNRAFTGFPALGIQWQRMESDALKRAYGMAKDQKGILVRNLNPTAYAAEVLQKDDIIQRFDGVQVSNDGTVPFPMRKCERIAFSYLVSQKFVGDVATLDILRGGQTMTVEVKLSKPTQLVPPHISNRDPSYAVVGGLVFTACIEPYLESEYGSDYSSEAPVKLLDRLLYGFPSKAGQEVVVLSQVLACEVTLGYEEIFNLQVNRFNGTDIVNLQHLAEMVVACSEPYMRFDLEYNEVLIVETQRAKDSTPAILELHSIPSPLSGDLRAVLPSFP